MQLDSTKKNWLAFIVSDNKWKRLFEIMLEDMSDTDHSDEGIPVILMKDAKLREYVNDPHQCFIYSYGLFGQLDTLL